MKYLYQISMKCFKFKIKLKRNYNDKLYEFGWKLLSNALYYIIQKYNIVV